MTPKAAYHPSGRFQPTIDLWSLADDQIKTLKPGQWVCAGPMSDPKTERGTFCGVRKSGVIVVAWQGNAKANRKPSHYRQTLMSYAKADLLEPESRPNRNHLVVLKG